LCDVGVEAFTDGWSKYLMQPILPASIAYVLLSFNAVLAPSGLMTTFLTQRGKNILWEIYFLLFITIWSSGNSLQAPGFHLLLV
jgi:hypothetical protein